jgi:hypothetical protein
MQLYLSGPMRGVPAYNHPAFFYAAEVLREVGHEVFSPAEHDIAAHPDRPWPTFTGDPATDNITIENLRTIIRADLVWICDKAEGIALLPGWERSKGVKVEMALAEFIGIPVKPWEEYL